MRPVLGWSGPPLYASGILVLVLLTGAHATGAAAQNRASARRTANTTSGRIHSLVIPGDSARSTQAVSFGRVRSLLDSATATLSRLEGHVTTLVPGAAPHPPHRHAHEELMLVERGTLEVSQEGAVRRAGPGALIFQAANELHGLRNTGADTAVYWVLAIYPRGLRPDAAARRP